MTVLVDPDSSPEVIFRDPAITIASVTATGSNSGDAAQLTRYSAVNVVSISTDQSARGVKLPSAESGDYFEIYVTSVGGYYIKIYDAAGDDVSTSATRSILRYVAGAWRSVSPA